MIPAAAARYRPLGCFRFGLALLVVLQHFQHLLPPSDRIVFARMGLGAIAVAVFFAVSGFVVAEANATFYAGRPAAFLANRAVRLVPPYFAALALSVLIHALLWQANRLTLWDYVLAGSPLAPGRLLSGVLGMVPGFNPRWLGQDFEFIPFVWTLRVEVAFYLAASCVMAMCVRWKTRWPVGVSIVVALAATVAFLRLTGRQGILSTAPMFLVGSCVFLYEARPNLGRTLLLVATIGVAAAGFASWRQHGAPVLAWQFLLLALLLPLFAWLVLRRGTVHFKSLDKSLGDLSYPLYLNHYIVGILAASSGIPPGWSLHAGAICCAILLAVVADRLVDRRLRGIRNRIRAQAI